MTQIGKSPATLVVGVGASAGGIEALQAFLGALPAAEGIAILVMLHLDPADEALLPEALANCSRLPVVRAVEGTIVEAGNIYALPGHTVVSLQEGAVRLQRSEKVEDRLTLIDRFMQALARDQGVHSVGVILSGGGSDGTLGLRAIARAGGLTMVQNPSTAKNDEMPLSASNAGGADHILPPHELACELVAHAQHLQASHIHEGPSSLTHELTGLLPQICEVLFKVTGHNFRHYKTSTVIRRTLRRIQLLRLPSANAYLELLHCDRTEAQSLFTELLINVTAFFRDPEAFETLADLVLPRLFAERKTGTTVRIWVPGCSTGEEAYSLAMLCREHMDKTQSLVDVQIFATDIDEHALSVARLGEYPPEIASQLSDHRLGRFFVKKGPRYQVAKAVRDLVLFSVHNLINDPPFSRLDMVSCRNLLIYLGAHLQTKLIPLFHYALLPGGYLFLGPSENLNTHRELFRSIDSKTRISQRLPTAIGSAPLPDSRSSAPVVRPPNVPASNEVDTCLLMQRIILDEFAPKAVLVNEAGQIMSASGNLEKYLTVSGGAFHNSISRLVRDELRVGLRSAFAEARKVRRKVVHDGVSLRGPEGVQRVMITVQPMPQMGEDTGLFMVIFQDDGLPIRSEPVSASSSNQAAAALIEQLERDLSNTRADLETTVQDLEAANEELKSSNEELLSMNEELQSANEELETSKEELQAVNEALIRSNSDLENLLASTRIATLFLDQSENVRQVTPACDQIYNILATDAGRPLAHFTHKATSMPPLPRARDVYEAERPIEHEVEMQDESWYLRRVLPYRGPEGNHAGIVVTFIDVTERRRYEERLRYQLGLLDNMTKNAEDERAKLAAVISVMSQGIVLMSPDGKVVKMNQAARSLYGFADEAEVSNISDLAGLFEAKDRQGVAIETQDWPALRTLRGEAVLNFEMHVRRRTSGHNFVGLYSGAIVRKSDGEPSVVVMLINDVTDRVRADAEMLASEQRFRQLAETIPQLAWMAKPEGNIFWYNQRWYEYTGTSLEDMQGWGWQKVHDPAVLPQVVSRWQQAIERQESFDMVFPLRARDGTFKPFLTRVNPLKDGQGNVLMWFGTNTDVSEERSKAEALRRQQEELRSLTDNTPDLLSRYDRQCRHVFVNAAAERQTGISRELFLGKTDRELGIADDLCALWEAAINKVFDSGGSSSIEFSIVGPRGLRHFAAQVVPEFGSDGAAQFALAVSHDVTAEKAAKEALQEGDRRKDEFLATLAHELRNPLAPLRTGLAALSLSSPDPVSATKIRHMMDRQLTHMVHLVDDLMDVSRISSGKVELRQQIVNVADVVDAAVEATAPALASAKHELSVLLPAQPLQVKGDPTRLAQAIGNLLNNAAKYTLDGGKIAIQVELQADLVTITVTDTGVGIAPEMLPQLFDMFTQVGRTLDRAQGGLGIGLSLVKKLIELHGGTVEASSAGQGQGSSFILKLPSVNDSEWAVASAVSETMEGPSVNERVLRVLVVDDNVDAAETLAMLLESQGHEIKLAHDGHAALKVGSTFTADVVFLDIGLPGLDGHEVARRFRQTAGGRKFTLVALTGWGAEEDKRRSREAGFDHHLTKPVSVAAILKILNEVPNAQLAQ